MSENKRAKILVMGVGGGGCNAVDSMIEAGVDSAEFVAVNTDGQALEVSKAPHKIAIGKTTTKGLGAGARPDVGKGAAEESRDEIRDYLNDVDMLFITAGMGGGTGTGAAPVIAQMAKEKNILTVAVVTKPFEFEGAVRMKNAESGIAQLKENVDSMIVIPNNNLLKVLGDNVSFMGAFKHADTVLRDAIRGLTDLIATSTKLNLDFADVKTIMKGKGMAHLAIGEAEGKDKTRKAVETAIMSNLLDTNISGATGVLLYIVGGNTLGLKEANDASQLVRRCVSADANIIFGTGFEESFGDKVKVLIVATGFEENQQRSPFKNYKNQYGDHAIMDNSTFASTYHVSQHIIGTEGAEVAADKDYEQQPQQPQYRQPIPGGYQAYPGFTARPVSYDSVFGQNQQQPQQPVQPVQQTVQPSQPQPTTNPQGKKTAPWLSRMMNRNI